MVTNGVGSHITEKSHHGKPGVIVNNHQIFPIVELKYISAKFFPRSSGEVWLHNGQFRFNRLVVVTRSTVFDHLSDIIGDSWPEN
jgi:hypothetical protein